MKTLILISSLLIATPAFAQANNPATNGGPVSNMPPMESGTVGDKPAPSTGMNPATNGGPTSMPSADSGPMNTDNSASSSVGSSAPMPAATAAAQMPSDTAGSGQQDMGQQASGAQASAKVPMCSRTVTDKCKQGGSRSKRGR